MPFPALLTYLMNILLFDVFNLFSTKNSFFSPMFCPLFFVVLLQFVAGCVAENTLCLELFPSLANDQYHFYKVVVHCADRFEKIGTNAKKNGQIEWDEIKIEFDEEEKCDGEDHYELLIGIINEKNEHFPIWPKAVEQQLAIGEGTMDRTKHRIKFDNYFYLEILPNLPRNSQMVYRVDVFCAGDGQTAEFKSFTQSNATVVISNRSRSSERCREYDVKVWPTHLDWVEGHKMFDDRPALVRNGVLVEDGTLLQIGFSHFFDLRISPRLEPNSDEIYLVQVKCHGEEAATATEAKEYRAKTEENARIVMGGEGTEECHGATNYDIEVTFVWKKWGKLDRSGSKSFSRKSLMAAEEAKELVPAKAKIEIKEEKVQILNGETHLITFEIDMDKVNKEIRQIYRQIDKMRKEMAAIKKRLNEVSDAIKKLKNECKSKKGQ